MRQLQVAIKLDLKGAARSGDIITPCNQNIGRSNKEPVSSNISGVKYIKP